MWDTDTGKLLTATDPDDIPGPAGADGIVRIWDPAGGACLDEFRGPFPVGAVVAAAAAGRSRC
ncbi:hypothetical protein AB0J72_54175 [Dactylosporangium sp. NPDC049742]|uniref:hypothetical protein n=1 Tax=Dactylosporangium sp. NPDC049742 TaxID=3154737 RepID=UPI00342EBD04